MPNKPLILTMNDSEREIMNVINKTMQVLPCYLIEMIIDKIHRQLKDGAKAELSTLLNQYQPETEEKADE